jgi:acyl-[acyl-carrier-protein] desaturase
MPEPRLSNVLIAPEERTIARLLTQGRAGEDPNPSRAPRRGSTNAQIEEIFFEHFLKYFQNAEAKRRWSVEKDIPWEKVNPESSELTAMIVESFSAVEMFLPDYTHRIMTMIRESRGRAWFQSNWGYEESKHSMALEEWLIRSGKRTQEQMEDFIRTLLGAAWQLPFESARQMIIYTMIQEMATALNYTNLRKRAIDEEDGALTKALAWVSADESAHYNFFRRGVKAYLELEPAETVADLRFVFENFAMPAHALIPEWEMRGRQIEEAGIYGPRIYLRKIFIPVLEDLGLTRQQLKEAGVSDVDADIIGDKQEQRAIDLEQTTFHRTYSFV